MSTFFLVLAAVMVGLLLSGVMLLSVWRSLLHRAPREFLTGLLQGLPPKDRKDLIGTLCATYCAECGLPVKECRDRLIEAPR